MTIFITIYVTRNFLFQLDIWNTDPDDILQDFLNDEQFNFLEKNINDYQDSHFDETLSDLNNDTCGIKDVDFSSSTFSDSGMSTDHVSPGKVIFKADFSIFVASQAC